MTTLAVVLVFVLLGLGVFFVAMGGGPRGAREQLLHSQSKTGRRMANLFFVVALLGLGIALPTAVIAAVADRDKVPDSGIKLNGQEEKGRELFGERCRNCHTLKAANAVAQVGPNLDNLRPPRNLVLQAIREGRARGNGAMAADLVEGDEAEAVAAFVAKVAGKVADD